jgi:hypothetical protein
MNKTIFTIIFGMFLLVSVSAMYAGESKNYSLSDLGMTSITDVFIAGNVSEIVYSFNNESATITIPFDAIPQEFMIEFNGFKEETPVVVTTSSGGGHSHKKKVNTTTNVSNNTNNETSNITLEEWNYTPPVEEVKPIEVISKVEPIINETVDKEVNKMDMNTWKWIIIGIIIFLIVVVTILAISSKKKKFKKLKNKNVKKYFKFAYTPDFYSTFVGVYAKGKEKMGFTGERYYSGLELRKVLA